MFEIGFPIPQKINESPRVLQFNWHKVYESFVKNLLRWDNDGSITLV